MIRPLVIATLLIALAACKSGDPTPQPATQPAPHATPSAAAPAPADPSDEHAPPGYIPGTWEDWCGGHGVPESLCTRCNASLIPAFKATGDWCAEHGLPESQCTRCNPDLRIVRPPKPSPAPAPAPSP